MSSSLLFKRLLGVTLVLSGLCAVAQATTYSAVVVYGGVQGGYLRG
jgi:hypothetical protein